MVGFDRPMFGADCGAFDQRQQIALHALTADIAAPRIRTGTDFVDFIQKHDAILFNRFQRGAGHRLIIQQLIGFFTNQQIIAFGHGHPFLGGASTHGFAKQIPQIHHAHLAARLARHIKHRHRIG